MDLRAIPVGLFLLAAAPAPELAGRWELDPEESDDPAEVLRRVAEEARQRGGRRLPPDGPVRPGFAALPEFLEIEQSDGEVCLVLEDRVQILYLDGEEHLREDGRGGQIETVAELRGGILRVEEKRRVVEVRRTFQAIGETLVVRTELSLPWAGDPVLLRTVYRRIP